MAEEYLSTDPNAGVEDQYLSTDPNAGLEPQGGVGKALKNAGEALVETVKGFIPTTPKALAEFATPVVSGVESIAKTGRTLSDVVFGGKGINEAVAQNIPESQILAQADQTPPFSKERFAAGFGMLGNIAMGGLLLKGVGKPLLSEISGLKPVEAAPESMPQTTEPLATDIAKQQTETIPVGGEINAEQIQGPTRPDVNVQLPVRESAREVGGGEMPPNVGGEGVPEGGQREALQQTQKVIPTQEELFKVSDELAKQHDKILEDQGIEAADKFREDHPLLHYGSADYRELMKIGKAPEEPALAPTVPQPEQPITGQPFSVTAYHGTRSAETLDPQFLGLGTGAQSAKKAFFFTKDRVLAQDYADMALPKEALEARRRLVDAEAGQEQLKQDIMTAPESEHQAMSDKYQTLQNTIDENKKIIAEHQLARGRREELGGLRGDKEARVLEQNISLQNPLVVDFKGAEFRETTYNEILEKAKKAGHDGVIFRNTFDPASAYRESRPTDIYAVFPETLKKPVPVSGVAESATVEPQPKSEAGASTGSVEPPAAPPPVPVEAAAPKTGVSSERFVEQYGEDAPVPNTGKSAGELKRIGQTRLDNFQKTGDVRDDPYTVLTNLREGKVPVSQLANDVSLIRAEHQRLRADAINAEGTPEYEAKSQAALDMAQAIKEVAHGPASDMMRAFQEYDKPRYDNVTDFDQALRERLGRESTSQERVKFKELADDVKSTRNGAEEAISGVQKRLSKMPKLNFEDAMKSVHEQIAELTKDCVL